MGIKHSVTVSSGQKGQAIEWNANHIIDGNVDFNQFQGIEFVAENRTSWPAGPVVGQIIYRTDLNRFFYWNGTDWITTPWYHVGFAAPTMTYNGEVCVWAKQAYTDKSMEWYSAWPTGSYCFYSNNWLNQGFTIGTVGDNVDFTITKVRIWATNYNGAMITVDCLIQGDAAGFPDGITISSGSFNIPFGGDGWYYCNMSAATLSASTKYHLIVKRTGGAFIDNTDWYYSNLAPFYAGGNAQTSIDGGISWVDDFGVDFDFYVYASALTTTCRLVVRSDGKNWYEDMTQL